MMACSTSMGISSTYSCSKEKSKEGPSLMIPHFVWIVRDSRSLGASCIASLNRRSLALFSNPHTSAVSKKSDHLGHRVVVLGLVLDAHGTGEADLTDRGDAVLDVHDAIAERARVV